MCSDAYKQAPIIWACIWCNELPGAYPRVVCVALYYKVQQPDMKQNEIFMHRFLKVSQRIYQIAGTDLKWWTRKTTNCMQGRLVSSTYVCVHYIVLCMYVYVRTYVSRYVCMHEVMYICTYICTYARVYGCVISINVLMSVCTYVVLRTYTCMHLRQYARMYVCAHTHTYTCTVLRIW